jgi:hypothetical protein
MSLITRTAKGTKLTITDMDGNLTYLEELAQTAVQGPIGPTGPQGSAGESVTLLGSYADLAAFNAGAGASPGVHIGDAWIILTDGSLYSWNGTSWSEVNDVPVVTRYYLASVGTNAAALQAGGAPGFTSTNEWNAPYSVSEIITTTT